MRFSLQCGRFDKKNKQSSIKAPSGHDHSSVVHIIHAILGCDYGFYLSYYFTRKPYDEMRPPKDGWDMDAEKQTRQIVPTL